MYNKTKSIREKRANKFLQFTGSSQEVQSNNKRATTRSMGGSASKVSDQMSGFAGQWNSRDVKGTQTELFWKIVSNDEEDFASKFNENQLDFVFTSDKIVLNLLRGDPGKRYNTLQLWRDAANGRTAIPILDVYIPGEGRYIVMMPLGEPGLHLGEGHSSKGSHLIVIKASREGSVTFNDMLPTTPEETNDFERRLGLIDQAYSLLKRNAPISDCGDMVKGKATALGVEHAVGIRQFLVTMIANLPDKGGRPGFTLRNGGNVNVADDTSEVAKMIESVFTDDSLKVHTLIQSPENNSVMISHIHGFLLTEVPECMKETYVMCDDILSAKREHEAMMVGNMAPEPEPELDVSEEEDNDVELTRQNTVVTGSS